MVNKMANETQVNGDTVVVARKRGRPANNSNGSTPSDKPSTPRTPSIAKALAAKLYQGPDEATIASQMWDHAQSFANEVGIMQAFPVLTLAAREYLKHNGTLSTADSAQSVMTAFVSYANENLDPAVIELAGMVEKWAHKASSTNGATTED
jgi:hypothetical protein